MKIKELSVLLALILGNFIAGEINCVGSISPYLLSYFSSINPSTTLSDVLSISAVAYILESSTFSLISFLTIYFSDQLLMSISLGLSVLLSVLTYFIPNPSLFYLSFGFSLGINATFMSYPLIWISWRVFPSKKGFLSGLSSAPYILSPFVTGGIFTVIVNSNNSEGYIKDNLIYFDENIYSKVPRAFLWLTGINLALGLVSIFSVFGERSQQEVKVESTLTVLTLLKQKTFWYLFSSLLFKIIFYHFLINVYKNLGMFYFNDDHYLNLVSGVAFSCCAVFKVVFGSFFDWYRWETLNFTFIVTEILIILIGPLFWSNKILFLVWVSAGLSVSGINFISILVLTDRLYPKDKWVMSFVAISFILDMILVNFYMGVLVPWLGYFWVFYSLLGFQAIAFALGVYKPYLAKPYKEELLLSS